MTEEERKDRIDEILDMLDEHYHKVFCGAPVCCDPCSCGLHELTEELRELIK